MKEIHEVGLVWSKTLLSTDRISKITKFQTFIVVESEICLLSAKRTAPLYTDYISPTVNIKVVKRQSLNSHFILNSRSFLNFLVENLMKWGNSIKLLSSSASSKKETTTV